MLPIAKFSFYSGNVTYSVVQNIFNLYERCKELLDTNGNGWNDPTTDFSQFKIDIEPLDVKKLSTGDDAMRACVNLAMNQNDDDNEEDMLVPMPKIETEEGEELSTIWLPLKRKHIFNVHSETSAFILFRYFVMVSQCYSHQGINQAIFNRKLNLWLVENILPYLEDDQLYPAFGGVLRILQTVKDPNESAYQGPQRMPKHNRLLAAYNSKFYDVDYSSSPDGTSGDHDYDWWVQFATYAAIAFGVILLVVFLCIGCRRCFRGNPGFFRKLLMRSTHHPETDDYYSYQKAGSSSKISFEDEKSKRSWFRKQKSKKPKSKDRVNLPLLGDKSESEEEIYSSQKSLSASLMSLSAKKKDIAKFKTSESSDDDAKSRLKKDSRKDNRDPKTFVGTIRSVSPHRKDNSRDRSKKSNEK